MTHDTKPVRPDRRHSQIPTDYQRRKDDGYPPNWVVVVVGIVLAIAVVAFALWRLGWLG